MFFYLQMNVFNILTFLSFTMLTIKVMHLSFDRFSCNSIGRRKRQGEHVQGEMSYTRAIHRFFADKGFYREGRKSRRPRGANCTRLDFFESSFKSLMETDVYFVVHQQNNPCPLSNSLWAL